MIMKKNANKINQTNLSLSHIPFQNINTNNTQTNIFDDKLSKSFLEQYNLEKTPKQSVIGLEYGFGLNLGNFDTQSNNSINILNIPNEEFYSSYRTPKEEIKEYKVKNRSIKKQNKDKEKFNSYSLDYSNFYSNKLQNKSFNFNLNRSSSPGLHNIKSILKEAKHDFLNRTILYKKKIKKPKDKYSLTNFGKINHNKNLIEANYKTLALPNKTISIIKNNNKIHTGQSNHSEQTFNEEYITYNKKTKMNMVESLRSFQPSNNFNNSNSKEYHYDYHQNNQNINYNKQSNHSLEKQNKLELTSTKFSFNINNLYPNKLEHEHHIITPIQLVDHAKIISQPISNIENLSSKRLSNDSNFNFNLGGGYLNKNSNFSTIDKSQGNKLIVNSSGHVNFQGVNEKPKSTIDTSNQIYSHHQSHSSIINQDDKFEKYESDKNKKQSDQILSNRQCKASYRNRNYENYYNSNLNLQGHDNESYGSGFISYNIPNEDQSSSRINEPREINYTKNKTKNKSYCTEFSNKNEVKNETNLNNNRDFYCKQYKTLANNKFDFEDNNRGNFTNNKHNKYINYCNKNNNDDKYNSIDNEYFDYNDYAKYYGLDDDNENQYLKHNVKLEYPFSNLENNENENNIKTYEKKSRSHSKNKIMDLQDNFYYESDPFYLNLQKVSKLNNNKFILLDGKLRKESIEVKSINISKEPIFVSISKTSTPKLGTKINRPTVDVKQQDLSSYFTINKPSKLKQKNSSPSLLKNQSKLIKDKNSILNIKSTLGNALTDDTFLKYDRFDLFKDSKKKKSYLIDTETKFSIPRGKLK